MSLASNYIIIDGIHYLTFLRPVDYYFILNPRLGQFESTGLLKNFFINWNIDKKNWFSTSIDIEKLSPNYNAVVFRNMHIRYDTWYGKTVFVKHHPFMELIDLKTKPNFNRAGMGKKILIFTERKTWLDTDTPTVVIWNCFICSTTICLLLGLVHFYGDCFD